MARKALPYGGLPRRHVRRITAYLDYLEDTKPCWDRLPPRRRPPPPHIAAAVLSGRFMVRRVLSRNSTEACVTLRGDDAEAIRALLRNLANWDYAKLSTDDLNTWPPLSTYTAIEILKQRKEDDNLPLSIEEAIEILKPPFSSEEEAEIRKQRQKSQQNHAAFSAWLSLVCNNQRAAAAYLADAGITDKYMLEALKAGLKVLRKKRLGRLWDLNPHQSFAAIGIISTKREADEQRGLE
jgi:hypothetical protein